MVDTRKIVRVFIASPGDLADERIAANSVVEEFNELWADQFGYQIELVGWEDTVSMFGRPQSIINKDLEKCELFVGLLWKRWGTPPDLNGEYSSGFEEEFEISKRRRERDGRPEISLYFKDIDQQLLLDPGEDLKKVIRFKEKIVSEKRLLFEGFKSVGDFQSKFRRRLSKYIRDLASNEERDTSEEAKTSKPASATAQQSTDHEEVLLPVETRSFLNGLLNETRSSLTQEESSRLRLIGQVSGVDGNDDQTIGVHDANILFMHRESGALSPLEISGLIDCGLEHFNHENCPLWFWIARHMVLNRSLFSIYATFGPTQIRRGALEAMTLIEEPFSSKPVSREQAFERLFAKKTNSAIKAAALSYLQECGSTSDLALLRKELEKGDVQTRSAAISAILHISFRDGTEQALVALVELQPEAVSRKWLSEVISKIEGVRTDQLYPGLESRDASVRLEIIKVLRRRQALDHEKAEKLLNDNSAEIRLEAINALIDHGRRFSEQEARRILVKPKKAVGLRSALGLGDYDVPGNEALERFRFDETKRKSEAELDALVQSASVYEAVPYMARAGKFFEKYGDELRLEVMGRFERYFERTIEGMAGSGWTADQVQLAKSSSDFIRKNLTRKALDIICSKSLRSDLGLLRSVLAGGGIDYSKADVSFLRAHGEWSDISLIVNSLERANYGSTGLWLSNLSHYNDAARAIHQIGKGRLAELLSMKAPAQLTLRLALFASAKEFRRLNDDVIQALLLSEDEAVRKAVSVKCILALPKGRLEKILRAYTKSEKFRYYNVIHWIDLGISLPRDRAFTAARKTALRMAE